VRVKKVKKGEKVQVHRLGHKISFLAECGKGARQAACVS